MQVAKISARDSSGKPTARNERGLVANSPVAPRHAASKITKVSYTREYRNGTRNDTRCKRAPFMDIREYRIGENIGMRIGMVRVANAHHLSRGTSEDL